MSLGSIVSTVLTKYKADTSDQKAALRSLRGEERARHKALLEETESANRRLDGHIRTWGKVAAGIGLATSAYVVARNAAKAYLEDVRLESSAAGADLGRLQAATKGLIETDQLLAFAGKSMNGVWKLNQEEMDTVLKGAMALRKTMGVELQPTIDSLTEAVAKGSTKAFKEFGIAAKDKGDALRQLRGLYQGLNGDVDMAGDAMQAAGVKMANTFDDLNGNLGKLVMELQPAIEGLASFVSLLADGAGFLDKWTDRLLGVDTQGGSVMEQRRRQIAGWRGDAAKERQAGLELAAMDPFNRDKILAISEQKAKALEYEAQKLENSANVSKEAVADLTAAAQKFGGNVLGISRALTDSFNIFQKTPGAAVARRRGGGGRADVAGAPIDFEAFAALGGIPGGLMGAARGGWDGYQTSQTLGMFNVSAQGKEVNSQISEGIALVLKMKEELDAIIGDQDAKNSILSRMFGTPAEIDDLTLSISMAADAFNIMTSAAAAAFDAWITGSKSIGAALTEAIADGLRASASQMLVESIKHTAFGIGALAFGGLLAGASAAQHFKAAAVFAGGAVVAGASAKALGQATGQWAQGGSGGGASQVVRGGRSDERSSGPITIYVGSEFAGLSGVEQAQVIQRAIRKGRTQSHIRRG